MASKVIMLASSGLTALALLGTASVATAAHKGTHYCAKGDTGRHCVRVKYEWVPVRVGGKHHARAHHAAAAPVVVAQAPSVDVSAMQAKIDALQARLDAAEAAQRATADQTAQVASQQTALSAQVAAAGPAIAGQIKSAINANLPKPNWASSTTVTGKMFFDFSNINQQSNGVKTQPSGTGFDIKRLYVGVTHQFDKTFSATTLIDYQSRGAYISNAALNGSNIVVKNAFVQAKLSDALIVRAGVADMPWIPFVDGFSGRRYIENSLIDRTGFGNSADWGIHALGTLGDVKGFNVTYQGSLVNGGGFRNPNRSNSVDLEGRVAANYHGIVAAVGGYTGKLAADVQAVAVTAPGNTIRTASRFDALVGYANARFKIGGEYFWAKDFSQATVLGGVENATEGYSAFGAVTLTPKWSVFGRFDSVEPKKYTLPSTYDNYYNFGITYSPLKQLDLSLVYKHEQVKSNNAAFAAGTVSSSASPTAIGSSVLGAQGTFDEIGLFGQVSF